jgi:CxxC-x17-CxxC domain-containing protein
MPEFQDRILTCVECGAEFIFTAGEQHFFHDKSFRNEPKRCKTCKSKRQGAAQSAKVETLTVCSQCGRETTVPFKPTQGRPVYCRECFLNRKATAVGAAGR